MAWPAGPRHFRSQQVYPELEQRFDVKPGEARLAAEVALTELRGETVLPAAHHRAMTVLERLAL